MSKETIETLIIFLFIWGIPGLIPCLYDLKSGRFKQDSAGIYIVPIINWLIFMMCIYDIYDGSKTFIKIDSFTRIIKHKKLFIIELYYGNILNSDHIVRYFNDTINFDSLINVSNLQLVPIKGVTTIAFKSCMDATRFIVFLEQNKIWDKIKVED